VIHLPEGKSIIMDSKVSLTAWTRYQAETDEASRGAHLKDHLQSLRNHIRNLADKRYSEVPELQSLDFVLLFVPIEAALIEALQADAELPIFALERKVALLSPTNLLATLRTVASVWSIHKQNANAVEIASRAGLLYDKFAGFVESLRSVGGGLRQAQEAYDKAFAQLSTGSGNLVRQTELLRELGARHSRQLDSRLTEAAAEPSQAAPEGIENAAGMGKN
jgi:DNA recombination protein RmuC